MHVSYLSSRQSSLLLSSKMFLRRICFVLLLCGVYSKIPNYITLCRRSDANLSKCLLDNVNHIAQLLATNGEPMFNIPKTDIIRVDHLEMQASPDLKVDLKDLDLCGLDKVEVREMTMTNKELFIKAYMPKYAFIGRYIFDGRLLILTIKSGGHLNVTQIGVDFEYTAKLLIEERHGKKYYYVSNQPGDTRTNITYIRDNSFFFGNLFPNDKRITEEMNAFLNENWRDVYGEVKYSMEDAYSWYLLNPVVNGFLRHIPIDSLFENE